MGNNKIKTTRIKRKNKGSFRRLGKGKISIEKYLVLNKYLLSIFVVGDFKELQEKLRDMQTGVDSDGRTYFVNVLHGLENLQRDKLSEDDLLKYDSNI